MTAFIIFLILSALFWGTLIYKTWQLDDRQKSEIADRIDEIKSQSSERLQTLRQPVTPPVDTELAMRLRAWSSDAAFISEDLYQWMKGLSDEHFLVITEFVAQFCEDMGFDLRGVLEGHYVEGDLDDTLERVVGHITESMRLVFSVREELLVYEAEKPAQPEIAGQIQQMMSNSLSSVSEAFQRTRAKSDQSQLNGHA